MFIQVKQWGTIYSGTSSGNVQFNIAYTTITVSAFISYDTSEATDTDYCKLIYVSNANLQYSKNKANIGAHWVTIGY